MKNYYQLLGIKNNASKDEIKKAFRLLATLYHPDRHPQNKRYFTNQFIAVKEAYDTLINVQKRQAYDLYLHSNAQSEKSKPQEQASQSKPKPRRYRHPDREVQVTPQQAPSIGLNGEKLANNLLFFKYPQKIGKISGAYSDCNIQDKPFSTHEKDRNFGLVLILGIIFCIAFHLLTKSSLWLTLFVSAGMLIATLFIVYQYQIFSKWNLFVGVNGFARYQCTDNFEHLKVNLEANFKDLTDVYYYETTRFGNLNPSKSSYYFYSFLNLDKQRAVYSEKGAFYNSPDKSQPVSLVFCRKVLQSWNQYLLDQMDAEIEKKGFILFHLYYPAQKVFIPIVKLKFREIIFIDSQKNEFSYRPQDIKRIFTRKNILYVTHQQPFVKLPKEQIGRINQIPLHYLCNRDYFFKVLETLLGYRLSFS